MNCIIPSGNIKVINKTLVALSRISDELYMECRPKSFSLVAMNTTKTVYAKYIFHSLFFLSYDVDADSQGTADSKFTCKIYMKSLLNIFKQRMEKKVETCRLQLEHDGTKLVATTKYKDDVKIVHELRLIDLDYLTIDYSTDDAKNHLAAPGEFYMQVLSNFQMGDMNMSLDVEQGKMVLRNYDVGMSAVYKGLRSQVTLTAQEFLTYKIDEPTSLVMSLKPFRAAISFAEHFHLNMAMHFKTGGWPIILSIKSSTFDVNYVLSSVGPDGEDSTSTIVTAQSKTPQRTSAQPTVSNASQETSFNADTSQRNRLSNGVSLQRSSNKQSLEAHVNGASEISQRNARNESLEANLITEQDREAMQSINWDDEQLEDTNDDSPDIKKARLFRRCFDPTFHASMLNFGNVLAENSSSDDDL